MSDSDFTRVMKPKMVRKMELFGGRDYPFYSSRQTVKSALMISRCVNIFHYDEITWTPHRKEPRPYGVNKEEDRVQGQSYEATQCDNVVKGGLPGN